MTKYLQSGDRIGTYCIDKLIGRGGMGAVYQATHALLGRPVAIKVLLPKYSDNSDVVRRFFNEARAITSVSHPGIVQIFDYGRPSKGPAYIVMELLEGESLQSRLRRMGHLPLEEAINIIRQMAGALAAAHERGVVHRDLKPENIFLVPDPEVTGGQRVKLLDFGIAKLLVDDGLPKRTLTHKGALLGTPKYMSPEQCRGERDIDHRADIYALGCLFYHLLCGRPPFVNPVPVNILMAHMKQAPKRPSIRQASIPPYIDAMVMCCLAKAREQRFSTMRELLSALTSLRPERRATPTVTPSDLMRTIPDIAPPDFLRTTSYQALPPASPPASPPALSRETFDETATVERLDDPDSILGSAAALHDLAPDDAAAGEPGGPSWKRSSGARVGLGIALICLVGLLASGVVFTRQAMSMSASSTAPPRHETPLLIRTSPISFERMSGRSGAMPKWFERVSPPSRGMPNSFEPGQPTSRGPPNSFEPGPMTSGGPRR